MRRQARRAVQDVNRQTSRDIQRSREAARIASDAIGDIPLRGLRGRARQQVASELSQRQADIEQGIPLEAATIREGAGEQLRDIRADRADALAGVRTQQNLAGRQRFDELRTAFLDRRRQQFQARRERQGARLEARGESRQQLQERRGAVNDAMQEIQRMLLDPRVTSEFLTEDEDGNEVEIPAEQQWAILEGRVASREGINLNEARAATRLLRLQLQGDQVQPNQAGPEIEDIDPGRFRP